MMVTISRSAAKAGKAILKSGVRIALLWLEGTHHARPDLRFLQ